jgi:hypothetical protein
MQPPRFSKRLINFEMNIENQKAGVDHCDVVGCLGEVKEQSIDILMSLATPGCEPVFTKQLD